MRRDRLDSWAIAFLGDRSPVSRKQSWQRGPGGSAEVAARPESRVSVPRPSSAQHSSGYLQPSVPGAGPPWREPRCLRVPPCHRTAGAGQERPTRARTGRTVFTEELVYLSLRGLAVATPMPATGWFAGVAEREGPPRAAQPFPGGCLDHLCPVPSPCVCGELTRGVLPAASGQSCVDSPATLPSVLPSLRPCDPVSR